MEVGPTTHYMMGGVRVDPESQMSDVPGLFAAGECGAGLHGANRLGGNSLSDLLVFGQRAGEYAAKFAAENGIVKRSESDGDGGPQCARTVWPHRERVRIKCNTICNDMMQDLVGIVRRADEMERALEELRKLRGTGRASRSGRESRI